MEQPQDRFRTLEETVAGPRRHRDLDLAMQPMHNFNSTPGGPHGQPLAFWAARELADRHQRGRDRMERVEPDVR